MSYLTRVMTGPTPQLEHGKRADLVLLDLWDVEELSLDPEVPVVAQGRAETVTLARLAPPPTNQFPRPPADSGDIAPGRPRRADLIAAIPPDGRWHGEKTPEAPDYFTPEETSALVAANPIYPVRMAMRIMLRTWLRVSECLSLCPADPPIISLRSEVTGNKVKRGREVHIPDDLVECLEDLVLSAAPRTGSGR